MVFLALLLRLQFVQQAQVVEPTRGDSRSYVAYAINLEQHHAFSTAVSGEALVVDNYRSPGYPLFLAACMLCRAQGGPDASHPTRRIHRRLCRPTLHASHIRNGPHAADVGMHDQRIGWLVRILRTRQGASLQAFARIGERALRDAVHHRQALQAHGEARGIHHGEHRHEALVRLADQVALRAVEIDDAGRRAVDAHLVLDRAALHRIARADRTIARHLHLGHDEQRDSLAACRRVRQSRQNQMHDVVGEVVFAGGDEDLGAADRVGAVVARFRARLEQAEVGSRMALEIARKPMGLLLLVAMYFASLLFAPAARADSLDQGYAYRDCLAQQAQTAHSFLILEQCHDTHDNVGGGNWSFGYEDSYPHAYVFVYPAMCTSRSTSLFRDAELGPSAICSNGCSYAATSTSGGLTQFQPSGQVCEDPVRPVLAQNENAGACSRHLS